MVVSFASDSLFSFKRLSFSFLMVSRASLKSLALLTGDVVWTNDILTLIPEYSSALSLVSRCSLLLNRILNCFPSLEKLGIVFVSIELPLKSRFSSALRLQGRDSSERDLRIACPCDLDSAWTVRWWDMSAKHRIN